jgi:hypothetical protein
MPTAGRVLPWHHAAVDVLSGRVALVTGRVTLIDGGVHPR